MESEKCGVRVALEKIGKSCWHFFTAQCSRCYAVAFRRDRGRVRERRSVSRNVLRGVKLVTQHCDEFRFLGHSSRRCSDAQSKYGGLGGETNDGAHDRGQQLRRLHEYYLFE